MPDALTRKLIVDHLEEGSPEPGAAIALRIDQTLTQDATGTLVMLALEAMKLDRVATEVSVQYVDHNLLQTDNRNADDHLFLESACRRFGLWFSGPGNGVSHPLHMKYFGAPGRTLLGSDSHTPAAGALGMLAIGAGGMDVAMAMAGMPYHLTMPEIWGIRLTGRLPERVSAKDVILELLRRHGVRGGRGRILEYHGPGLEGLSVMDRHVIANMGTELGATTSVFPSDGAVRDFLRRHEREAEWREMLADEGAGYDIEEEMDLSTLEPLIARPSSPGNVVPVREVAGTPIYQSYVGSSANPGFRDYAAVAEIVRGRRIARGVSLDINPSSRGVLRDLTASGHLADLLAAGARLHQAGCNGCIGMGQAPASGRNSLRTVPRNFPGRSGTAEDSVWLCSPETAAAAALAGRITDPRELDLAAPAIAPPARPTVDLAQFAAPDGPGDGELVKGPNIADMPRFGKMPDSLTLPVLLTLGDDISTDEIMPAGAGVLPYRSNIPRIADFVFRDVDPDYPSRAREACEGGGDGHAILVGENYGQGSSREHAAAAPRALGLRAVIGRSIARIHAQNLINYGILPLTAEEPGALDRIEAGTSLTLEEIPQRLRDGARFEARLDGGARLRFDNPFSARQADFLLAGGAINWCRAQGLG